MLYLSHDFDGVPSFRGEILLACEADAVLSRDGAVEVKSSLVDGVFLACEGSG